MIISFIKSFQLIKIKMQTRLQSGVEKEKFVVLRFEEEQSSFPKS